MTLHSGLLRKPRGQTAMGKQYSQEDVALLDTASLSDIDLGSNTLPRSPPGSIMCNVLTVLICLACVGINWFISLAQPPTSCSVDVRSIPRSQYHTLRRPSPFIGFDSISRASPAIPRSLLNYPTAIALVNSSSPHQVFSDDPKQHMTSTGTVSPEVRPVVLTNEVGVIVQFRAMDYQMERCQLHIKMAATDTASLQSPKTVGIYRLALDQPLNTKEISYSTRPARIATVGNISITPSSRVSWHHDFRCVWDSVSTFEVAYLGQGAESFDPGEDFTIQWWQDKDQTNPAQAIYIMQHESA